MRRVSSDRSAQEREIGVQLAQRVRRGAVEERPGSALAGVAEGPDAFAVGGRRPSSGSGARRRGRGRALDQPDHPGRPRPAGPLEAEGEGQEEHHLRVGRSLDRRVERGSTARRVAPMSVESARCAVVHPQPAAVAERVAVRLLHRRAGRGPDVGEEQRGADVVRRARAGCGRSRPGRRCGRAGVSSLVARTSRRRSRRRSSSSRPAWSAGSGRSASGPVSGAASSSMRRVPE